MRIRIHFIRIRIQAENRSGSGSNAGPDPVPIRIQGFNDQKLKKITAEKKNLNFFLDQKLKNVQVTEEAFSSQKRPFNTSKHELKKNCFTFVGHFCPPGSGSTDPIESGSGSVTLLGGRFFDTRQLCIIFKAYRI